MTMPRQHFALIAEVLKARFNRQRNAGGGFVAPDYALAKEFADALAHTNPNFNRDRFLRACGVDA